MILLLAGSANLVGETKVEAGSQLLSAMCAQRPSVAANQISLDVSEPTIQTSMISQLSLRTNPANPNHHLWNNNGTWFVHYVIHPTPVTKERVRRSLKTKCVHEARARRDALLAGQNGLN